MPYPSTLAQRGPLSAANFNRFDPEFTEFKDAFAKGDTLLTFDYKSRSLVLFHYPCYEDGQPVPPEELLQYWESHDMPTPVCFCVLKTGEEKRSILFLPRYPTGEHLNQPCLTCADGLCGLFRNLKRLYDDHKNLPCKQYPLLAVVRRRITPPRYDHSGPTTPKRRRGVDIDASMTLAGSKAPSSSLRSPSIVGPTPSPQAIKRPASASPANRLLPKIERRSPVKSEGSVKLEGSGGPAAPYLGDHAIYTQNIPKPFPMDAEPTPAMLKGMYGADLARMFGKGEYGSDPAFVNGLLRLYSPGLLNRVNHQDAFPEDKAVEVLLKVLDPTSPGITVLDLTRILARCMRCSHITLHANLAGHRCPPDDDDDEIEVVSVTNKRPAADDSVEVVTSDRDADGSTQGSADAAGSECAGDSEEDRLAPPKKKTRLSGPVPRRTDWAWHNAQANQAATRRTAGGSGVASSSRSAGGSRVASSSRSAGGSRGGAGRAAPPVKAKVESKARLAGGECKERPIDVDGLA